MKLFITSLVLAFFGFPLLASLDAKSVENVSEPTVEEVEYNIN